MKYTNEKLAIMYETLAEPMKQRNIVGYKCAVNARLIRDCIAEFYAYRDDLLRKYGTAVRDDNGRVSDLQITPESANFDEFVSQYKQIADVEHDLDFKKLSAEEVIDVLSGEEILAIDWMIEND